MDNLKGSTFFIHPVEYGDKNLHLRANTLRNVLLLFSIVVHFVGTFSGGVTRIFVKLSQGKVEPWQVLSLTAVL